MQGDGKVEVEVRVGGGKGKQLFRLLKLRTQKRQLIFQIFMSLTKGKKRYSSKIIIERKH